MFCLISVQVKANLSCIPLQCIQASLGSHYQGWIQKIQKEGAKEIVPYHKPPHPRPPQKKKRINNSILKTELITFFCPKYKEKRGNSALIFIQFLCIFHLVFAPSPLFVGMQGKSAVEETIINIFWWVSLLKYFSFSNSSVLFLELYRQKDAFLCAAAFS